MNDEDKVKLYRKLCDELEVLDSSAHNLKNIIKNNHKEIKELREDVKRWKETCFRQVHNIDKMNRICDIQVVIIVILVILSIGLGYYVVS